MSENYAVKGYLGYFYRTFGRLPTKEEHLDWIKLHVMSNKEDYEIIKEVKECLKY